MTKGWKGDSYRHSLSSRGIPNARQEVKTYQARFNPEVHNLNPPVTECPTCGSKFTKRGFSDECPQCEYIDDQLFGEDLPRRKQEKLEVI